MTLEETVLDLRKEIESILPQGWKVWARLDLCDFQFFGYYGSVKNCVHSPYFTDSNIPLAKTVSEFMQIELEHMNFLGSK